MTGQAVLPEGLDRRVGLRRRIKGRQAGDPAGAFASLYCGHAQAGIQIRLRSKGITDIGNRTGVSGLDTGSCALDMVGVARR